MKLWGPRSYASKELVEEDGEDIIRYGCAINWLTTQRIVVLAV